MRDSGINTERKIIASDAVKARIHRFLAEQSHSCHLT